MLRKMLMVGLPVVVFVVSSYIPDSPPVQRAVAQKSDHPAPSPSPAPVTPAYLKLPATRTANANRYFCIKPNTNCAQVKWIVPKGLDTIDPEIQVKDTNAGIFIGSAGVYTVQAYGALGNQATDVASCIVTVGTPPAPPSPVPPVPPTPPDPLAQALQAAYAQDTDANKATEIVELAQLYLTASTTTVNDSSIANLGDLFQTMKTAAGSLMPAAALPNTAKAVSVYVSGQLGTTAATPLDSTLRSKAGSVFAAVAKALSSVVK